MTDYELEFPAGDQVDLECMLTSIMIQRAIDNPQYAFDNQWGETNILQGNELHTIQWQYVGIEPIYAEDSEEIIGYQFEDGPDFEVSCSWCENENYNG